MVCQFYTHTRHEDVSLQCATEYLAVVFRQMLLSGGFLDLSDIYIGED